MLYRMKQNAVGLANICILSTMVLVILSSTCSLWFGAEDMIHTRYPADVLVSMEDPNHMIDMDTFLTDELKSVPGGSYTSYEFLTGYDSTEETEDHSSAIFMKDGTAQVDPITRNVLFFSAETYNRITGENVTVKPGTALYMSIDGVPMPDTMTFAGTTYTLLPTPKSFNLRGRYHAYVSKPYVVVLPDYAEKSQVITPTEYYCISLGKLRDEEQQTFYDAILEDVTTIMPDEESVFWEEDGYFNFECRVENTKEIRSMYGSFLFMGISLGFVFTMTAVLIIYYKQISEGMEDKNRFAIIAAGRPQPKGRKARYPYADFDRFLPAAHHSRHPRDVRVPHHPRYSARYDAQLRNGVYYLHRRVVPRILRALCGRLCPHRKGVLPHHQRR